MFEILKMFALLACIGGGLLFGLLLLGISVSSSGDSQKKPANSNHSQPQSANKKGDENILPQHLWEQISKIIEENTGNKIPRAITPAEILASIPEKDRAKVMPTLIPIVVDFIRESTGMKLDASLALEEFFVGQGLGLTELDVAVESDAMKLEKTLAAQKRYKEIADRFKEELGDDPVVDFTVKMFLYKLLQETFKDIQLPPGWSPQQVAGLSPKPLPNDDGMSLHG